MDIYYYTQIIGILVGGFFLSFLINTLVLYYSDRKEVECKNDVNGRWSIVFKPSLGGISMYTSFLAISILLLLLNIEGGSIFKNTEFLGLFIAAALAFSMGAADDYYSTKPLLKLSVQILCGIVFVFTDNSIILFHNYIVDGLITIIWVVGVMNSLNMLDNMDGITSTVSIFILLACTTVFILLGSGNNVLWIIIMTAQMGTLIGFLCFNINPSRMFMGDSGSQFIALFVSFFGIKALWNLPSSFEMPAWSGFFIVLAAFTPAAVDTLTVVINRKRRGVSVALGGKDHTTHHLAYRGYSDFKVWVIFMVISIFSYLFAVQLAYLIFKGHYFYSFIGLIFFLSVFIPLYRNTLRYPVPGQEKSNS